MPKKLLTILVLLLLKNFWVFGDNVCGTMFVTDTTQWGQGVLWLNKDIRIKVNNGEKGRIVGSLYRVKERGNYEEPVIDGKHITIDYFDLVHIGHSTIALLKVYKMKDSKNYLVFKQSVVGGLWISQSDLDKANGKFFTYKQLFFDREDTFPEEIKWGRSYAKIGINLIGICLNLRVKPDIHSEKKLCLNSFNNENESHTHLKMIKHNGNWAYVEATLYIIDPAKPYPPEDCVYMIKRKETGWIKAIADDGHPNIWFSVSNY